MFEDIKTKLNDAINTAASIEATGALLGKAHKEALDAVNAAETAANAAAAKVPTLADVKAMLDRVPA